MQEEQQKLLEKMEMKGGQMSGRMSDKRPPEIELETEIRARDRDREEKPTRHRYGEYKNVL